MSNIASPNKKILEMVEKDSDRYKSITQLIELVCKRFKADLVCYFVVFLPFAHPLNLSLSFILAFFLH